MKEEQLQLIKTNLCRVVVDKVDFTSEISEEKIYEVIDEVLIQYKERSLLAFEERIRLRKEIFCSLRKLDVIEEFLEDDTITEIMINGTDPIYLEKFGHIVRSSKRFTSLTKVEDIIQQIAASSNRIVNEASPIVDATLRDGSRVNIVLRPIALNGPIITIRRFPKNPITMDKLCEIGTITREAANFLAVLVERKYNIFISGGTGSGKTTFLNALSQFIPCEERIITIEDSAELQLLNAENLVRLEARNATQEGCKEITIRDLIRTALRMRPERIIVGEVRGAESIDMLQAMNTGHDGSLSTGHANSAKDMLNRLETMVMMGMDIPLSAVRGQIAGGIDILVHLGRVRDRSRKVLEICEVNGMIDNQINLIPLYRYKNNILVKENELIHTDKMVGDG